MSSSRDYADKLLAVQSKITEVESLINELNGEDQKTVLLILQGVVEKLQSSTAAGKVPQMTCKICSQNFSVKRCYEKHIQGHSKNDCSVCGKSFSRRRALVCHLKEEHKVVEAEKLYECTLCPRKFAKKTSLIAHSASHASEQGKVACSICGLFFSDETELNRHNEEHDEARSYACTMCPRRFKRKQQHEAHMQGHEKNRCAECGTEFSDYKLLSRHCAKTHNLILGHRKRSSSPGELVKTIKPGRPKKNRDNDQPARTEWSSNVDAHMCDRCGGLFSTRTSLNKHSSSCNPSTNEYQVEAFKCNECDQVFNDQLALVKHSRAHDVERPFLCHCGRNYKHLKHLQKHLLQRHNTVIRESSDRVNDDDGGDALDADAAD